MKTMKFIVPIMIGIVMAGCNNAADEPEKETVIIRENKTITQPAPVKDNDTEVKVKVDRDKGVEFELNKDRDNP